jgi:hypothetical protein
MVVASAAPFTSSNGAAAPAVDAAASSSTASLASANPLLSVPISVLTDSYKASHFLQYPAADKLVAVGGGGAAAGAAGTADADTACVPCSSVWHTPARVHRHQAVASALTHTACRPGVHALCCPVLPLCSTASSAPASTATQQTRASWCLGCATSWRTTCCGAGHERTWTVQRCSTGGWRVWMRGGAEGGAGVGSTATQCVCVCERDGAAAAAVASASPAPAPLVGNCFCLTHIPPPTTTTTAHTPPNTHRPPPQHAPGPRLRRLPLPQRPLHALCH